MCRADCVILFGGALKGGEVLLTEVCELVKIAKNGKSDTEAPHLVVPMMGRFKV